MKVTYTGGAGRPKVLKFSKGDEVVEFKAGEATEVPDHLVAEFRGDPVFKVDEPVAQTAEAPAAEAEPAKKGRKTAQESE